MLNTSVLGEQGDFTYNNNVCTTSVGPETHHHELLQQRVDQPESKIKILLLCFYYCCWVSNSEAPLTFYWWKRYLDGPMAHGDQPWHAPKSPAVLHVLVDCPDVVREVRSQEKITKSSKARFQRRRTTLWLFLDFWKKFFSGLAFASYTKYYLGRQVAPSCL